MRHTYLNKRPFGYMHPVLFVRACDSTYGLLSYGNVCARASVHVRNFAFMHARTISLNIYSRALASIRARTSMCIFIRTRASVIISASSGCSACIYVILINTLLCGELGHGFRTSNVYIWGAHGDYLYHSLEYLEHEYLKWLGEEICKHFSCWAIFQWQVPVLNMIPNK